MLSEEAQCVPTKRSYLTYSLVTHKVIRRNIKVIEQAKKYRKRFPAPGTFSHGKRFVL
jgi:hypothetical protein